jgi:ATP-dependent DNA helicase RecG
MHGQAIMLAIYDDRIEIDNPGGLPPGMTVDQLKRVHRSVPRNELIAEVFFRCKIIERWGRGTMDMINFCKQAGAPAPKFEDKGGFFSITLRFKEPIRYVQPTREVQQDIPVTLTTRQKEIWGILKQGTLSRDQIMEQLKQTPAVRTVQLDLLKLESLNIIIKSDEKRGRFVRWALNQEFNAQSMRNQYAINAHKPVKKKTPKTK